MNIFKGITRRSRKTAIPEINTQPIENRKIKIPEASARQLEQSKPTISKAHTERTEKEKATKPTQRTEKGKMPVSETRKVSTGAKKATTSGTLFKGIIKGIGNIGDFIISKLIPRKGNGEGEGEGEGDNTEIELAKEKIEELKERIKEMDEEGYIPQFSHSWNIAPKKMPNSRGAGRMKETSGNIIIDTIDDAIREKGYVAVARVLEANWDEIIYYIERLEFAIYDGEYRKRSGGRSAYNAGLMRLKAILMSET